MNYINKKTKQTNKQQEQKQQITKTSNNISIKL